MYQLTVRLLSVFLLAFVALVPSCVKQKDVIFATTTSTQDTGLLDELIPVFERQSGYRVKTADNAFDAILRLNDHRFNLILSDINMPGIDGLKLFEIMLQKGIRTPLMFLTSSEEAGKEIRALELGAMDFIRKPFQKDVLKMRIKRAIAGMGGTAA